jgi:signal transduction histidine kinase
MELWQVFSTVIAGMATGLIGMSLLRLPRSSITVPVYVFVACGVLWAVGDLLAETASDMRSKQIGLFLLYTGSIALPACWWAIALRWAKEVHAELPLHSAVWQQIPFAFAGLMWLTMITNPWHGAFMTPIIGGRNVYQPLWYTMAIPNYALIVAALVVELAVVVRVALREVRRQGAFLISASLLTLIGNWIYVNTLVPVNLTPLVLSASAALLVLGMAREGLFGVLPSALRDIASDHPDGLVVIDPRGYVRFANARAHELLAPVAISSNIPFVRVLRDDRLRPEVSSLFADDDEAPWPTLSGGVLFRLDAGRGRWLHFQASPVTGYFGRTRGYGVRIIDLTAHHEIELHARQDRRLNSTADLARTISRQFQGTFVLVQNNAEMLLADSDGDTASERKLARIIDAAKHGSDLALQLQLYTGSVSTERVVLELSDVVQECSDLIQADLPVDVSVVLERSQNLLPVYVDAIQIRHCVFEVLNNALEAMAASRGEIRVWTGARRIDPSQLTLVSGGDEPVGDYAYVRILDAGGGMDPETEERAFEPFFSTRGKDRGVGLPTALGIARAHRALVMFQNVHGRGCDVTLLFPMHRDESGEVFERTSPRQIPSSEKPS